MLNLFVQCTIATVAIYSCTHTRFLVKKTDVIIYNVMKVIH